MTSSHPTIGTKVGRARRSFSQLWQVPTFVLGLLAFIAAAASAPWRHSPEMREFERLSQVIRQGLANPDTDADPLLGPAESIIALGSHIGYREAEGHFLIGSVYYRQAQQKPPAYAREVWPRAEEYLHKAVESDQLSTKDRPAAHYRLGYSLHQQGKTPARAIELMTTALEKGAEAPLPGYQLLVQANLKLTPPNLDGALAASRRILDVTPETNIDALAQARIAHGELLMRKEAWSEALKIFEMIGAKASRALRVQARLLEARCCAEEGEWVRAVPIWRELLKDAAHVEGGVARIHYALGLCYRQMDPPNSAETIKAWTEALERGGAAGQAAGFRLGEFHLAQGGEDAGRKALTSWKKAMENVARPTDFKNTYVQLDQVLTWFKQALRHVDHEPEQAEQVAELFRKLAPSGAADLAVAEARELSAKQLDMKLMEKTDGVTPEMVAEQFRRAGEAYEQAAKARPEKERADCLWRAIQCQLKGKDQRRAQETLQQFVKTETNERRLAEGWFTRGELFRGDKDKDNAHTAYLKCLAYPKTPFAYRARIYLAIDAIEKKDFDQAHSILEQNLKDPDPAVDGASREKSAFEMGRVLLRMKKWSEASTHLSEFVRLYPENANVVVVRVQLGECYREMAKKELANEIEMQNRARTAPAPETRQQLDERRRHHRVIRMELLANAIDSYQRVIEDLDIRQRERSLDRNEEMLQRRAKFGIGECRFDTEEYIEGLRVFQALQSKHRQTVEGFWAGLRICNLAEVLRDQPKLAEDLRPLAKESLRLLLDDLKAMPADHEVFRTPGVEARESWQRWADEMQKTLDAPPKVDRPGTFP